MLLFEQFVLLSCGAIAARRLPALATAEEAAHALTFMAIRWLHLPLTFYFLLGYKHGPFSNFEAETGTLPPPFQRHDQCKILPFNVAQVGSDFDARRTALS